MSKSDLMPSRILAVSFESDDLGRTLTIRDYLVELLLSLWDKEESFSGKRPFGNSGWQYEVYAALIAAKMIDGTLDEYGHVAEIDRKHADSLIEIAICALGNP